MYKIFLAWQSQDKEVTKFIRKQIIKSIDFLKDLDVEVIMSPTQNESGSPDIVGTIWEQISKCDVFIGDVTHICEVEGGAQISNSNVMYEIGIADSLLGEKRVILLAASSSDISKLAFDINHKRISTFKIDNQVFYKQMSNWIAEAIKESTIQFSYKRFVCNDVIQNVEIIYNNLMRIIHGNVAQYPDSFRNINSNMIKKSLQNNIFNSLEVKVDYSGIIIRLEKSVKELFATQDKDLIYRVVEVLESLKDYQSLKDFMISSLTDQISKESPIYFFQDQNSFALLDTNSFDELKNELFFRDNILILSIGTDKPMHNVFLMDTIKHALLECNIKKQHNMIWATMDHYKFKEDLDLSTYSIKVFNLIKSIEELLEHLNYAPTDKFFSSNKYSKRGLIHFNKIKL